MNELMRGKWRELLAAWSVDSVRADRSFHDIRERYAGPGRFYLTLDHMIAAAFDCATRLFCITFAERTEKPLIGDPLNCLRIFRANFINRLL